MLEMRVDVERYRMETVHSQPAPPPQYDLSPRRSPAVGTASDEPGVSRAESQSTEKEVFFLFKPMWMVFCASPAQARSKSVFCFKQTSV